MPLILQERVLGWDCELFDPISCHVPPATIQISGRERAWVVDGLWLRDKETQRAATGSSRCSRRTRECTTRSWGRATLAT